MSRESVLARGRAFFVPAAMDECLIERQTGSTTPAADGTVTPTYTTVYEGPCRVQEAAMTFSREANPSPDQTVLARPRSLQLPVETSEGVRTGDVVTITACVNDPDLVGARMIVRDQAAASEKTSRRLGVEEING